VDVLVQLSKKESGDELSPVFSIRSLRIFSLHKSIYNEEKKIFIHFILVIGYTGGGCQEECLYKIEGSNLEKSSIFISTSAGGSVFQYYFSNLKLIEFDSEMCDSDLEIQNEFIDQVNNFLTYNEAADYFFFDKSTLLNNNGFMITEKFPLRTLKFLNTVYWPFSTSW
jgi:hypothetical protein